jgi:DHA1 family bicyclomycin/chloramphenicol resistance-like MFS transporter
MKGAYNLILMIGCYFMVNGIYVPAMPNIAEYFHVEGTSIRETITIFQAGALLSCILAGFFADYIGKKNFLLIGLSTATLGSLTCLVASDINFLLLGRFMQGMGAATGFMMGFALAVDLYKPHETLKIIALNGIITSMISVFIPFIGGNLTEFWDWRATFIFITPLFAFALINSARSIPSSANVAKSDLDLSQGMREVVLLSTNKTYLGYAMLNGIFVGALTFSISFLPFFFKNIINLSEDYIGLAIGFAIWFPFGISSIYSVKLYDKFGIDKTISYALFICFASAVALIFTALFFQTQTLIILAFIYTYFLGFGLMYSGSITKSMSIYKELTTKASAIRTIMISFFSFCGSLLAQIANDTELLHLAFALTGTVILSMLFFVFRTKKLKFY